MGRRGSASHDLPASRRRRSSPRDARHDSGGGRELGHLRADDHHDGIDEQPDGVEHGGVAGQVEDRQGVRVGQSGHDIGHGVQPAGGHTAGLPRRHASPHLRPARHRRPGEAQLAPLRPDSTGTPQETGSSSASPRPSTTPATSASSRQRHPRSCSSPNRTSRHPASAIEVDCDDRPSCCGGADRDGGCEGGGADPTGGRHEGDDVSHAPTVVQTPEPAQRHTRRRWTDGLGPEEVWTTRRPRNPTPNSPGNDGGPRPGGDEGHLTRLAPGGRSQTASALDP